MRERLSLASRTTWPPGVGSACQGDGKRRVEMPEGNGRCGCHRVLTCDCLANSSPSLTMLDIALIAAKPSGPVRP
jgi:hypothetical protein